MGAAKTAGERVREIFLKGGRDLPSCFAVHDYLGAIPADAPEQIAELETRREETIAMCEQLRVEKDDLTAKLAGVMGALEVIIRRMRHDCTVCPLRDDPSECEPCEHRIAMENGDKAIADEPPASKRYRAIKTAAEALEAHDTRWHRVLLAGDATEIMREEAK